jgi:tetratricopeptide (TPR) repeat protein
MLFLVPFLPVVLVHAGISRYLYLATAGWCLLTALLIEQLSWWLVRRGRSLAGRLVYAAMVLLLLASSYMVVKRVEVITLYDSGRHYINARELPTAIALLKRAIEEGSEVIPLEEAYYYLIDALIAQGDEYHDTLEQAATLLPDDPRIAFLLGISQYLDQDQAVSQEGLRRLREVEAYASRTGQQATFLHMMAVMSQHFGEWFSQRQAHDKAIEAFQLSLQFAPQNTNSLKRLLRALLQAQRCHQAVSFLHQTVAENAEDADVLYLAALCLKDAGQQEQALEAARRALLLRPEPGAPGDESR